jgi:uracil DNA glycosylase
MLDKNLIHALIRGKDPHRGPGESVGLGFVKPRFVKPGFMKPRSMKPGFVQLGFVMPVFAKLGLTRGHGSLLLPLEYDDLEYAP